MALEDYGALIQSGMNLVPDMNKQLLEQAQTAALQGQARNQQAEAQATAAKLSRAQQFQEDIHTFDGSPTSASRLIMKYPEFADHLKQGWDVHDNAKKEADLLTMGEIYSAASGGNWKLAKQLAHTRADAEKAAGFSDPAYEATLGVMDEAADGDPTQQKVVLNMLGTSIAAVTGPEHFATVYGGLNAADKGFTLDAGATRYDANGKVVVQSPYVKTADGGILERDGTGGGDPASPGAAPATAPGGFDHAVEHVLSNEGGYNPSDMNGAPVNFGINQKANPGVDVKNMTVDQAKQIYHDKYWVPSGAESLPANLQAPYFDVYIRNPAFAKKALADSGGDPAKFMAASSAYFQKLGQKPSGQPYAEAWANRDAKNTAIATGGVSSSASPTGDGAPPGYHWLTPPKPKDAPSGYRYAADGKTLEAIPGGPAEQDAGIDDQTATFYAQQMLAGGQMPTLGMGKAAAQARQKILKKVATIAGADGLTGNDLAVQVGHYKANVANVQNLEKQAGTIEQNEQTALMNGQQFLDRSKELPGQTGVTALNSVVQSAQRHLPVSGHDTVAAMDAAWNTFTTEYAKVVAGSPSGAGTLSDSARHEAQSTMKGNYSYDQKIAAFKQMQADMSNRMAAIKSQIAKGYKSLGSRAPGLPGSDARANDLPKGARVVGTYQGKRVIEVNGKRMVEQ